ncbi:MAG TPA: DNA-binding response regulator [Lachnospiraceae bacterium]|jgi:DNA-binding response OmpR family regulator|nr:DNA-binding response regulator [Lachnospiraceae bacterium]HBZ89976.1 DNA-binding response regulator [Lachnospiraceae bacterium]
MAKKILVVDDEKLIVKGIKFAFDQDGYEVDCAYDGEEALKLAEANKYDTILLDVMLPGLDGMQVCQRIREFSDVPIIMLTAKGDDMDKILGFEYGADDYITKPFNILEVKARVKAIVRRAGKKASGGNDADTIKNKNSKYGDFEIDHDGKRVFLKGAEINLTSKEFDLLELLITNPNKVYSRESLLKTIWNSDFPGDVRTVDVHVRRLREKVEENPAAPKYVQTKWGVGYFFKQN